MERLPHDMLREVWWRLDLLSKDLFRGMCKATAMLFPPGKNEVKKLLRKEVFLLERADKYCRSVSILLPESAKRRGEGKRLRDVLRSKTAGSIPVNVPEDHNGRGKDNVALLARYAVFILEEQERNKSAIEKFNNNARTKSWQWLERDVIESTFREEVISIVMVLASHVREKKHAFALKAYSLWLLLHCWDSPEEMMRTLLPQDALEALASEATVRTLSNAYFWNLKLTPKMILHINPVQEAKIPFPAF